MFLAGGISPNSRAGYTFLNIEKSTAFSNRSIASPAAVLPKIAGGDPVIGSLVVWQLLVPAEEKKKFCYEREHQLRHFLSLGCVLPKCKSHIPLRRCSPLSRFMTNASVLLPEVMA